MDFSRDMADSPKIQQNPTSDPLSDAKPADEPSFARQILDKDAAQAERLNQTVRETVSRDLHSDAKHKASSYAVPENHAPATDTQQTFGRKINVNPEVARQQDPQSPPARPQVQTQSDSTKPAPKQPPQTPAPKDFSQVLQSRVFQGPLQNSPAQQKLQQQFQVVQDPRAGRSAAPEAMSRGEVLQLFSMRLRSDLNKEEREALRRLIKYEAGLANAAKDRVRSIQYQTQSDYRHENVDALMQSEKTEHQDSVHRDLLDRLARGAESLFEKILQKVLGQNRSAVGDLPEGASPDLPTKESGEWEGFYARVKDLQSALIAASASSEDVDAIIYRGLMNSDGQIKLISDLALRENGDVAWHKFAQLLLSDPALLNRLQALKPGQNLPADLVRALGEQIAFLKLVPLFAGTQELSEMEKQELLRKFRAEMGAGTHDALEKAMRAKREVKPKEPFAWAGDQFDKKEERRGPQTFLMYLLYFTFGVGFVTLLVFLILRYS